MKKYVTILFLAFIVITNAQKIDYNTNKGFVAEGYDVTEYFNNKVVKGSSAYITTHDKVNYKFSSKENLEKFRKNPGQYIPQYGGYCAYAVAVTSEKVDINPKTFEIRNGKLYLFYNSWGINTLDKWIKEDAEKLEKKANINWQKIKK
ncbi:YHS domain-containing (seleno)protein [Aquimarina sp. I32.4]|uniref:YHS domain-containing (seleno)protein n=1 Tax=Aquimarina sp. I32.4 TaxID=2053903 RepID=UPI000CDEC04A|nr:YHS domain-containing (seleno)protein [Aquimarina sp. I32.4]